VGDYVQITDEILPPEDPYWSADDPQDRCWDDGTSAAERQKECALTYGPAARQSIERDFPILEAYDDHFVLGRYGRPADATSLNVATREVVAADPSNKPFLHKMRCCFHKQVGFQVRTGSTWVTVGSAVGLLHHTQRDPAAGGACVQSCASHQALLNARAFEMVRPAPASFQPPDRNSPLALRNPMFSFLMWGAASSTPGERTSSKRGFSWRFNTRGQFQPAAADLSRDTTALNPQSMKYIEPLGVMGLVDGASAGLVLYSLQTFPFKQNFF
jgi:hypothetical protein